MANPPVPVLRDVGVVPEGILVGRLANALGDPERGLIPRGVRAVEASAAEGRREDVQADIQRGLEAARATFTPEQAPGIGQATQGPDPRAVAQEMERRGTPIDAEGVGIAQELAREQAQERRAAQAAQAAPAQEGLEAVYLDLEAALDASGEPYLKRHQMTRQQQAVVAQISREEVWKHEGVYSPKVGAALKKRVDEQAATARQHADTAASPLFGGRAASKRKDARERDIRRRLMRELGVETVGDVIAHTYEHFQEHGELSGEVMRDAWLALEDAAAADPQYIRENMGAKEARLEFLRALNTMRSGQPIDPLDVRWKTARTEREELKLKRERERAGLRGGGGGAGDRMSYDEFYKKYNLGSIVGLTDAGEGEFFTPYGTNPALARRRVEDAAERLLSKRDLAKARRAVQRLPGQPAGAGPSEADLARVRSLEGKATKAMRSLEDLTTQRNELPTISREGMTDEEFNEASEAQAKLFDELTRDIGRARADAAGADAALKKLKKRLGLSETSGGGRPDPQVGEPF